MTKTLIVPGLGDSGPEHWQTWIEGRLPASERVTQPDWGLPDLDAWAKRVAVAVDEARHPPIVVAHSFGCLATVRSAAFSKQRIGGALLVAPADPEVFGYADLLPQHPLPYPVTLVASRTDPWMRFERAAEWAARWNATLVDLGNAGHINVESGHGVWPEGLGLLRALERATRPALALVG